MSAKKVHRRTKAEIEKIKAEDKAMHEAFCDAICKREEEKRKERWRERKIQTDKEDAYRIKYWNFIDTLKQQIDEIETPLKLEIQRKTTPLQEQIRRFQEAAWGLDFHHKDGLFCTE